MTKINNIKSQTSKRKILRNNMTESEIILWSQLQKSNLGGFKFRRQHGIGRYVLDFYCPNMKLAIEIDGESHLTKSSKNYDFIRQKEIESAGITFLRFTNTDIKNSLTSVLKKIYLQCISLKK